MVGPGTGGTLRTLTRAHTPTHQIYTLHEIGLVNFCILMQVPVMLVEMGLTLDQLVVGSLVTTVPTLISKVVVNACAISLCVLHMVGTGRAD